MNETEKRELNVWLHEALGNCAHEWESADGLTGREDVYGPDHDRQCIKCGIRAGGREHVLRGRGGRPEAPDYTGKDWPALAEAMRPGNREPGYHVRVDFGIGITCIINEFRAGFARGAVVTMHADTPGEAVCMAARQALEAEVS